MKSIEEVRYELRHRIQTEGVLEAYEGALRVLRDPKSPPAAIATASSTLFRVAGLYNRPADSDEQLEPHEMTSAQLAAAVRRADAALAELRRQGAQLDADADHDIFS